MLPKLDNSHITDKIDNQNKHIEKLKLLKEFLCKDQVSIRPMPMTVTNALFINKENQEKVLFSALLKKKYSPTQQQKKSAVSDFSSIHTSIRKKANSQRSTYHRKYVSLNHKNNTSFEKSPKNIQNSLGNKINTEIEANKAGKEFQSCLAERTNAKIRSTSIMKGQKALQTQKIKDKQRVRLSDIFDVVDRTEDCQSFKQKPKNKKRKCYLQWNCNENINQKFRVFKIL